MLDLSEIRSSVQWVATVRECGCLSTVLISITVPADSEYQKRLWKAVAATKDTDPESIVYQGVEMRCLSVTQMADLPFPLSDKHGGIRLGPTTFNFEGDINPFAETPNVPSGYDRRTSIMDGDFSIAERLREIKRTESRNYSSKTPHETLSKSPS